MLDIGAYLVAVACCVFTFAINRFVIPERIVVTAGFIIFGSGLLVVCLLVATILFPT